MRAFRAGRFLKQEIKGPLRAFCPTVAHLKLSEVPLKDYAAAGKKLILLDVDNTLLLWKSEEIPDETFAFLEQGKGLGMQFCIISNTRRVNRLGRICQRMGIDYVRGRFKPSRRMFQIAMEKHGATPEQTLMVGDQLFTDIWGANRAGIDALWIQPMGPRELFTTRFNRFVERWVRKHLYRYLDINGDGVLDKSLASPFFGRRVVREFLKFCVVGAASTIIDWGIHYVLMFGLGWRVGLGHWVLEVLAPYFDLNQKSAEGIASGILKIPGVLIAIYNSFYWNRRWTFRVLDAKHAHRQLVKFYAVAFIGLALSVLIVSLLSALVPGHPKRTWAIANAIATVVVVFWNFTAQKLWTFRREDVPS